MIREMSVNGQFYPNEKEEIEKYIAHFNRVLEENALHVDFSARAIIVPHAGYIYSGFSANIAYKALANSGLKRFVVFGPSHQVAFHGSSLCMFDSYATPLGALGAAKELAHTLQEKFNLPCAPVHKEHSTETQFPFVKHYMPDATIVEVVYSDESAYNIAQMIKEALSYEDTGIIISTDLSHFHTLKKANFLDENCIEAIDNLDIKLLSEACEACGKIGVEAMIRAAKELPLESQLLDYRTSADVTQDESSVVGYLSAAFY